MQVQVINKQGVSKALNADSFTFSGGEEHVRFEPCELNDVVKVKIYERLVSSANIIRLMMATDALKRMFGACISIELVCPYFPYARQDRVCVEGEALAVSVMADIINRLDFDRVTIWDAHSDVTGALINNVKNIAQIDLLKTCKQLCELLKNGKLTLVAPDAGAAKKTEKISEAFSNIPEVIQAQKKRDLKTGKIIKTEISDDVTGKDILISDDICDGGRTFIELAKVLKEQGANKITLFVTHGIFSKGLDVFDGLIDEIYTTDSMRPKNEFIKESKIKLNIIEM
ncbi:ribose-phosphate diphosphokinase [Marinicellulosiphila megalodicopiae]|uniref:ribose-phosphate diphosphokinase n=1 Tax=Marinicellulosiphila megalodicopiae TaxID=2724896 RepID=UPI003BAE61F3